MTGKLIWIITFVSLALALIAALFILLPYLKDPAHKTLAKAGIVEKQALVNGVLFNYAEGPDNGPPLVLLHAQLLDWFSYNQALPELTRNFHVFAIDYPGHGQTRTPADYSFTANQIGSDLASFIRQEIGQSVYLSGNSSGGLLCVWLASNTPDLVEAVVLEDPPLFSAEYPAIKDTIAYKSFTTSNSAITSGYTGDFLTYWVDNSTQFFRTYTGPIGQPLIRMIVQNYKKTSKTEPVEITILPRVIREMIRGLSAYDPAFGNAFYTGTWNSGFDHATALRQIQCPVLLLQADFSYTADGILNGAMSQAMADRAAELIPDCTYQRIESNHVINLDHPGEFVDALTSFFL